MKPKWKRTSEVFKTLEVFLLRDLGCSTGANSSFERRLRYGGTTGLVAGCLRGKKSCRVGGVFGTHHSGPSTVCGFRRLHPPYCPPYRLQLRNIVRFA